MKPMPKHIENKIRKMIKLRQQANKIEWEVAKWFEKQGSEILSPEWDTETNDQLIDVSNYVNCGESDISNFIMSLKNEYEEEMGI